MTGRNRTRGMSRSLLRSRSWKRLALLSRLLTSADLSSSGYRSDHSVGTYALAVISRTLNDTTISSVSKFVDIVLSNVLKSQSGIRSNR
jgi:hypothetical protein